MNETRLTITLHEYPFKKFPMKQEIFLTFVNPETRVGLEMVKGYLTLAESEPIYHHRDETEGIDADPF